MAEQRRPRGWAWTTALAARTALVCSCSACVRVRVCVCTPSAMSPSSPRLYDSAAVVLVGMWAAGRACVCGWLRLCFSMLTHPVLPCLVAASAKQHADLHALLPKHADESNHVQPFVSLADLQILPNLAVCLQTALDPPKVSRWFFRVAAVDAACSPLTSVWIPPPHTHTHTHSLHCSTFTASSTTSSVCSVVHRHSI